jgi:hypothetical protein
MFENPLTNAAIAFVEPLPVALVIALVSAGVLSLRHGVPRSDAMAALPVE